MTDFIEGARYLVLIAFWDDTGTPATFTAGKFAPEGFESDPERHFPPHLVEVLSEMAPEVLAA